MSSCLNDLASLEGG